MKKYNPFKLSGINAILERITEITKVTAETLMGWAKAGWVREVEENAIVPVFRGFARSCIVSPTVFLLQFAYIIIFLSACVVGSLTAGVIGGAGQTSGGVWQVLQGLEKIVRGRRDEGLEMIQNSVPDLLIGVARLFWGGLIVGVEILAVASSMKIPAAVSLALTLGNTSVILGCSFVILPSILLTAVGHNWLEERERERGVIQSVGIEPDPIVINNNVMVGSASPHLAIELETVQHEIGHNGHNLEWTDTNDPTSGAIIYNSSPLTEADSPIGLEQPRLVRLI